MPSINSQPQTSPAPPVRPVQPAQTTSADTAASTEPGQAAENLQIAFPAGGSAQLSVSLDGQEAIKAWKQAASGPKLELKPEAGARMGHLKALMDCVTKAKNLNPEQKARVSAFVQDFSRLGAGADPRARAKAMQLLDDMLAKQGISQPQLQLIADDKFMPEDLLSLVRQSSGPGLVGSREAGPEDMQMATNQYANQTPLLTQNPSTTQDPTRYAGLGKPPQGAPPPVNAPFAKPAPSAGSLKQPDSLSQKPELASESEALDQWEKAAKGQKIPLLVPKKTHLGHILVLRDQIVAPPRYTPQQQERFQKFLKEFSQLPSMDPTQRPRMLQLLDDSLKYRGITEEQIKLIIDGDFDPEDFRDILVNHNFVI